MHIETEDGHKLGADFFPCEKPVGRAIIASAMGVKRRWYRAYAQELANKGIETLILDYRGIGDSGSVSVKTSLREWAERDLAAGLSFLRGRSPALPLFWIGHSVGGQLFGLMRETSDIRAVLLVASQSGYWKNWRTWLGKSAIFALWNVLIPVLTAVTGKLPMRLLGQGEDVPKGVAREWARWGRHPRYIMRDADGRDDVAFKHFAGPVRAYAMADDNYAPVHSTEVLCGYFAGTQPELKVIEPAAFGVPGIGHFNFFRERHRGNLWQESQAWLLQHV